MRPQLAVVPPASPERHADIHLALRDFVNSLCAPRVHDGLSGDATRPRPQIGEGHNMNYSTGER